MDGDKVTNWFDRRYKPRYNGLYEIKQPHWPWPYLIMYKKETGWSDTNFTHWRGIVKND